MKNRTLLLLLFLLFQVNSLIGQQTAIGEWRSHLPYRHCTCVAEADRLIYCATTDALFYFDRDDNSIGLLNKVNGLSDIGISCIRYNTVYKILVVTYTNANIDLVTDNGIINISDIKRKTIYGDKTINRIMFLGPYAYLSCGFGIVVLDLVNQEIADTYYIGPQGSGINVNDMTYDSVNFYAATASGIYVAQRNNLNLANYAAWVKDTSLKCPNANYGNIASFGGKIITSIKLNAYSADTLYYNDGSGWQQVPNIGQDRFHELRICGNNLLACGNLDVYIFNPDFLNTSYAYFQHLPDSVFSQPLSAIEDAEGYVWIADQNYGLVKHQWGEYYIQPNGPGSSAVYSMTMNNSDLWVAPGSTDLALSSTWNTDGPFSFIGGTWYTLKDYNPVMKNSFTDILYIAVDPTNNKNIYAASWGYGLIKFNNGIISTVYNDTTSMLEAPYVPHWVLVGGLAYDQSGNLWMINSGCNSLLKALKPDGTWQSFNVASLISAAQATRLFIDSKNNKWVLLYGTQGILVYNDNGTIDNKADDQMIKLNTTIGDGNLPSNNVYSIAEDLNGEIWVGTDKGIAVFYTPENLFTGSNFDSQVITIEQDSVAQHLLEYETVTALAVDGANKKWAGTLNSGVYLFSDDGQKQIYHFTVDNSPLLSNTINAVAIDGITGEVYFGTDKGICSFKGYAITGQQKYEGVYAYPNPVPGGYTGMIGIRGLTANSWIKITDVTGTLIYETRSEGGQAVWNGNNFYGKRAKTGVYFVFCISEDGSQKMVTKILLIN